MRVKLSQFVLLYLIVVLSLGCDSPQPSADVTEDTASNGAVTINEISCAGELPDWVELHNGTNATVDIGGWMFTDSDPEHVYIFKDKTTISAGGFLVIYKNETDGFTFGLGNADQVQLYDAEGMPVDAVGWESSDAPKGTTYGRIPDGTGAFATLYDPTPGAANRSEAPTCGNDVIEFGEVCDGTNLDGDSCLARFYASGEMTCASDCSARDISGCKLHEATVVINEVSSSESDGVELYNVGSEVVDLTGWILSDARGKTGKDAYTFPPGTTIAPKSFLVLTNETFAFGLGSDDAVTLYNTLGLVDIADYGVGEAAVSYCRKPDGTGKWSTCASATFDGPN